MAAAMVLRLVRVAVNSTAEPPAVMVDGMPARFALIAPGGRAWLSAAAVGGGADPGVGSVGGLAAAAVAGIGILVLGGFGEPGAAWG